MENVHSFGLRANIAPGHRLTMNRHIAIVCRTVYYLGAGWFIIRMQSAEDSLKRIET